VFLPRFVASHTNAVLRLTGALLTLALGHTTVFNRRLSAFQLRAIASSPCLLGAVNDIGTQARLPVGRIACRRLRKEMKALWPAKLGSKVDVWFALSLLRARYKREVTRLG
jgi:hypothetical protein